ncbi:hypothetical protein [Nonomuraea rosea]
MPHAVLPASSLKAAAGKVRAVRTGDPAQRAVHASAPTQRAGTR